MEGPDKMALYMEHDTITYRTLLDSGRWSLGELDRLIRMGWEVGSPGERIGFLSEGFLGTPYKASTMIGGPGVEEVLVINLAGVDCFTFLDYVEAMRRSESSDAFKDALRKVRYRNGVVSYTARNHFFSDWMLFNGSFTSDVTADVGGNRSLRVEKVLNRIGGNRYLLPGIEPVKREIVYIPSREINETVVEKLNTGDYLGVYSELDGLDVSHVGIVIRKAGRIIFRHASSSEEYREVIDQGLVDYLTGRPGIVVVRPH